MMPIAGYADRLSVRPGETIAFKVSSQLKGAYNAHLVRIVSGDANPKGPGLVEHKIEAPFAGAHPSRNQPVHQGSYARIDAGVDLSGAAGLTFVATIWPTTPGNKRQGILSAYDPNVRLGFALAVGEDGSVEALLGATRVKTRVPLETRRWYRVFARFDAATRVLSVGQVALALGVPQGSAIAASTVVEPGALLPPKSMPWIIGALGGEPVRGHFNGKIEAPAIHSNALPTDVACARHQNGATEWLVARWEFSRATPTARIIDGGPNALHGNLVNLPARAMTGSNWTGREMCFRHAPEQYGAIHFHDDDLYDCGWSTDFSWTVPDGTRSGVYAVRLTGKDGETERQENIPFFVVPPKGERTADVCVLMSTYTYTVYHNHARPEAKTGCGARPGTSKRRHGALIRRTHSITPSMATRPTISIPTAAASVTPRGCGRC